MIKNRAQLIALLTALTLTQMGYARAGEPNVDRALSTWRKFQLEERFHGGKDANEVANKGAEATTKKAAMVRELARQMEHGEVDRCFIETSLSSHVDVLRHQFRLRHSSKSRPSTSFTKKSAAAAGRTIRQLNNEILVGVVDPRRHLITDETGFLPLGTVFEVAQITGSSECHGYFKIGAQEIGERVILRQVDIGGIVAGERLLAEKKFVRVRPREEYQTITGRPASAVVVEIEDQAAPLKALAEVQKLWDLGQQALENRVEKLRESKRSERPEPTLGLILQAE